MTIKHHLLAIVCTIVSVAAYANNQLPVSPNDPFADAPSVIGFVTDQAQTDVLVSVADTTITIYGSGGMNNESGTICPNTAASECAKIIIHGLVAPGSGGSLSYGKGQFNVVVQSVNNVVYTNTTTAVMEGKDLRYRLNN